MGMTFLVDEAHRLPQLNAVMVPQGVDELAVRMALLERYSLEIGAGLGPYAGRIWRIGLMGHSANERNVLLCLGALETVLAEMGVVTPGRALPAARAVYTEQLRAKAA
jgi:alanine-glyoxylate transaminase / serine-glyoxylate transaminase / serine-pyruvate transaminase